MSCTKAKRHVKISLKINGGAEDNQVFMNSYPAQEILGKIGSLTIIELAVDLGKVDELVMIRQLEQSLSHARIISVRQAVMGRNVLVPYRIWPIFFRWGNHPDVGSVIDGCSDYDYYNSGDHGN